MVREGRTRHLVEERVAGQVLEAQARRMLADPRAEALTEPGSLDIEMP